MEDKGPNNTFAYSADSGAGMSIDGTVRKPPPFNTAALEADGVPQAVVAEERMQSPATRRFLRSLKKSYVVALVLLFTTVVAAFVAFSRQRVENNAATISRSSAGRFNSIKLPLSDLLNGKNLTLASGANVTINGTLQVGDTLQIAPTLQPTGARPGQIYYDQNANQLAYYNGSGFVFLTESAAGSVQSLGGATGQLTLGGGLSLANNQLANNGVLSVQGQNGAITFTAGAGIVINGTSFSNSGVISIASGSPNVTVNTDGAGHVTLSVAGESATVASSGGTTGQVPIFTAAQDIEDSIISQAALAVTVAGDLTVTGSLTLGNVLGVGQGGTGVNALTANGVLVGNGGSAISSVAAGGAGLCLLSTSGVPTWGVCSGGGGGVASLNGLNGALNLANASGSGTTITIDNASTSAKGIASFNATNFSVAGGAVNTIQNIGTGANPTFAGVNTSAITPSSALTLGATGQSFLLQGNAASTLTASNGGSATTVSFQSPTANVTYRFLTAGAGTYDICTTVGNCVSAGGGVTTPGGSANRVAKFTAGQAIANSSITDDGTNVLTSIDLVVQGGDVTVGVPTSQTGTINLAHSASAFLGSILQGSLSANRTYTLPDASGTFCLSSGNCGVTSLNGLVGALSIANASAAGSTITINDATTLVKGIASFSGTNFSVTSGAVNTIQDINTTATPTFAGVSTNSITPSAAFTIGSTSQTALLRGSITTITSSGAGDDIILNSADTIELQGTTNVTGNIDVSGTLTSGTANSFQVAASGDITTAGSATAEGGIITAGTSTQAGSLIISDGSSNTGTLQVLPLGQNTTYTLPDPGSSAATICLTTGNCASTGGGVTTAGGSANRLAKFSGAQSVADSTITDNGTTVTTSVNMVVQGGSLTVGTSSQLASLLLHDGNGQTTALQSGDSTGDLTFILPTNAGNANQCLKQSGSGNQLIWDPCDGGGGGTSTTLQNAYNNGNSFATTDNRDVRVTLADTATDSNFAVTVADGATGFVSISRANGTGAADPAQLLLITNLDTDRAVPAGIKLQSASGGMTTAIDATDAAIVDAINVATNNIVGTTGNIDFTNFDVIGTSGDVITTGNATLQGGTITVGTTSQVGSLVLSDGSSNTGTLQTTALAANRVYTFPDATGTVCLSTGNCAGAGVTLQNAYSNSSTPEMILDATRGALTVRDSSGGIGANLFEVQNNNGSVTYLGVTSSGVSVTGTITSSASIDISGGSLLTGGTARIDSSGNLTNVGNITGSGAITLASSGAGNNIVINGANILDVQDATTFASTTGFNGTATFSSTLAANSNVSLGDSAADLLTITATLQGGSPLVFEGATTDASQLTLSIASLTADQTITLPDETGTVCLRNSTNCGFATSTGSGNYIQNQSSTDQTGDFRITGTGRANTALQAPLLDTATAVALSIGTSNATGIELASNASAHTINIGSGAAAQVVTIGSTNTTSATTIQAGTGNLTLQTNSASASIIAKSNTNSTTAFQIQNAAGTSNLLVADTTNTRLGVGKSSPTATLDIQGSVNSSGGAVTLQGNAASSFTTSTGDVSIAAAANLNLGTSGGTVINLGTNNAAHTIGIGNTGATGTQAITIGGNGNTANTVTIDAGTGTSSIAIGNSTTSHNIAIGAATTGSNTSAVTIGSNNAAASTVTIQGGNGAGAVSIQAAASGTVAIGTANDNVITIGNTSAASTLTLGQSTASNTIAIGSATTAAGNTQTVNIATSATGTGKSLVTIGNTNGASALTLQAGTGNLNLLTNSASASVIVKSNTNAVTALQVQNASSVAVIDVDTSNKRLGINNTAPSTSLDVTGEITVTGQQPASSSGSGSSAVTSAITGGKGGNTSGTTGQTAGSGGAITIYAGTGGDAPSGSTNGSGGAVLIHGGAPGSGAGSANFIGNVILQETGGYVGIGELNPTAFLHIKGSDGFNADLLKVTDSTATAADVFRILDEGAVISRNRTNSTTALQVQNASSLNLFTADTSGLNIQIGSSTTDANAVKLVLDSYNQSADPSGTNGAMYYNTALQQYRCYRASNSTAGDGTWEPCGINPIDRGFMVEDDFLGGTTSGGQIGQLGWSQESPGGSSFAYNVGGLAPTADHPGMVEITTGATNGGGATLTLNPNTTAGTGASVLATGNVVKSTVGLDTTLANAVLRVGLSNEKTSNARPVSGVWWEAAPSVNAKWQYCYGNGTAATCAAASSNANIVATQWYRLEIRVTATGPARP